MRAKINDSLSAKVFLWIAGSLILCSFLIYGSILFFLPKSYVAVSSEHINTEIKELTETLSKTKFENAKDVFLSFLAGTGHSEESNMGTVKAVRDSSLCQAFLDEEYELAEGEHIRSEDNGKILISKALAEQNNLAVGDKITLTHAKLGSDDGVYTDLMKEKSAYETVEIKGIYDIKNASDNALNPTVKKAENLIFSDCLEQPCHQYE